MSLVQFLLILVSVSLNAAAQVLLRKAMLVAAPLPPVSEPLRLAGALMLNPWLYAGLSCYVFSIGLWLAVLARTEVSVAYPMLSIGYIIAAVIGVAYLGEQIGLVRAGGIALICLGVVLVARSA